MNIKDFRIPLLIVFSIIMLIVACNFSINGHICWAILFSLPPLMIISSIAWIAPAERVKATSEIVIPVVIAVVGYFVTNAIKQKEVAPSYINTAIGILTQKENGQPLKKWAVSIINRYSEVPLPSEVVDSLISGNSILIVGASGTLTLKGAPGSITVDPTPK